MTTSRGTLVRNQEENQRKVLCYSDKITRNNELRNTIESELTECNEYAEQLRQHSGDAIIFSTLYENNIGLFDQEWISEVLTMLDNLGTHLESEKQQASRDVEYWENEVKSYDKKKGEEIRKEQEARRNSQRKKLNRKKGKKVLIV